MRKEFEPYEQDTRFTCAPASLKIGYKSLGQNCSEKLLREEMGTDIDGTYWREVMKNPGVHGFRKVYKSRLSYSHLRLMTQVRHGFVVVSFMNYRVDPPEGHFAILKSALDDYVKLMDPGVGRLVRMTKIKWQAAWNDQSPQRPAMLVWKED